MVELLGGTECRWLLRPPPRTTWTSCRGGVCEYLQDVGTPPLSSAWPRSSIFLSFLCSNSRLTEARKTAVRHQKDFLTVILGPCAQSRGIKSAPSCPSPACDFPVWTPGPPAFDSTPLPVTPPSSLSPLGCLECTLHLKHLPDHGSALRAELQETDLFHQQAGPRRWPSVPISGSRLAGLGRKRPR